MVLFCERRPSVLARALSPLSTLPSQLSPLNSPHSTLNLVLDATDRVRVVLAAVVRDQVRVTVVQEPAVGEVSAALRGTPEVRVALNVIAPPIAIAETSGARPEAESIRAVSVATPADFRFKRVADTAAAVVSDIGRESVPFFKARQMPTFGTSASDRIGFFRTSRIIATTLAIVGKHGGRVHRRGPQIKATVLGAVCRIVVVAVALGRVPVVVVVQVPHHPDLGTYLDRPVGLAVAEVRELALSFVNRAAVTVFRRHVVALASAKAVETPVLAELFRHVVTFPVAKGVEAPVLAELLCRVVVRGGAIIVSLFLEAERLGRVVGVIPAKRLVKGDGVGRSASEPDDARAVASKIAAAAAVLAVSAIFSVGTVRAPFKITPTESPPQTIL